MLCQVRGKHTVGGIVFYKQTLLVEICLKMGVINNKTKERGDIYKFHILLQQMNLLSLYFAMKELDWWQCSMSMQYTLINPTFI